MSFPAPFNRLAFEDLSPQPNPLVPQDPASMLMEYSLASVQQPDYAFGADELEMYSFGDIGHTDDLFQDEALSNRPNDMVKPHACSFPGCLHRAHSKRDLDRHSTARHLELPKDKFFCPEAGCRRSRRGWPGTRKDLRDRHVRTVHPKTAQQDELVQAKGDIEMATADDVSVQANEIVVPELRQDIIVELKRKNARLESQLDEMQKKYEKMRSMVMIAVAAAE